MMKYTSSPSWYSSHLLVSCGSSTASVMRRLSTSFSLVARCVLILILIHAFMKLIISYKGKFYQIYQLPWIEFETELALVASPFHPHTGTYSKPKSSLIFSWALWLHSKFVDTISLASSFFLPFHWYSFTLVFPFLWLSREEYQDTSNAHWHFIWTLQLSFVWKQCLPFFFLFSCVCECVCP